MGVVPLVNAGVAMFFCLGHVDHGDPNDCSVGASSGILRYILMAEPLRILVVWSAFTLLACGYARGGPQQLVALEAVRIDLADGTLDGVFDQSKARALDDDDPHNDPDVVFSENAGKVGGALREMQQKLKAPVRHGRSMPYFFAYDVLALVTVTALMLPTQEDVDHGWMVWVTLHYMNVFYSLLALPFVLLALPFISTMLTQAYATGYDKAGNCGGMLTPEQIKQVREMEGRADGMLEVVKQSNSAIIAAIQEGVFNVGVGVADAIGHVGRLVSGKAAGTEEKRGDGGVLCCAARRPKAGPTLLY